MAKGITWPLQSCRSPFEIQKAVGGAPDEVFRTYRCRSPFEIPKPHQRNDTCTGVRVAVLLLRFEGFVAFTPQPSREANKVAVLLLRIPELQRGSREIQQAHGISVLLLRFGGRSGRFRAI